MNCRILFQDLFIRSLDYDNAILDYVLGIAFMMVISSSFQDTIGDLCFSCQKEKAIELDDVPYITIITFIENNIHPISLIDQIMM
jgi:hypothetical protein